MNSEEIKKEMVKIGIPPQNDDEWFIYDAEIWHSEADKLLIKVLRDLGYDELCNWWESGEKWYA